MSGLTKSGMQKHVGVYDQLIGLYLVMQVVVLIKMGVVIQM